jgi:hypothetical protein
MLNEEGKSKWYWIAEQLAAGGNFEGVVCKSYNSLIRLVHIIGRHFFLIELGGRTCFMPFFWDSDFFLLWQLSVFSDNWYIYIYIYIATLIPLAWCLSLQKAFWVSNPCFWIVTKKQSSRKMSDWSRGMEDLDLVLRWMLSNNLSGSWWNLNMVFLLTIHSWFQLSTFTPACMHLNAVWVLLQFSLIRHFNCWTTCREGGKHICCAWWAWSSVLCWWYFWVGCLSASKLNVLSKRVHNMRVSRLLFPFCVISGGAGLFHVCCWVGWSWYNMVYNCFSNPHP